VGVGPQPCWLSSRSLEDSSQRKSRQAITGRLISQLPTRRRFHRTADFDGAAAARVTVAVPHRRGTLTRTFATSANPND
jgi:hypothetical protein